jgi:hypothetical protein
MGSLYSILKYLTSIKTPKQNRQFDDDYLKIVGLYSEIRNSAKNCLTCLDSRIKPPREILKKLKRDLEEVKKLESIRY